MIFNPKPVRFALLISLGLLSACGATGDGGTEATGKQCQAGETPINGPQQCSAGLQERLVSAQCQAPLPRADFDVWEQDSPLAFAAEGEADGGAAPARPTERPAEVSDESRGISWQYHCLSDSECTEREYGQCRPSFGGLGELRIYACEYGCATDADCTDGNACRCADHGGQCVSATCRTSDDCGSGKCAAHQDNICGTIHGFACTDFRDQCYQDADCADQGHCYYNPDDGYRICSDAVCGRPFLVEQASVLAEAVARADWAGDDRGARPHPLLDESVRFDVASAWTQIGLMEHASIAAFARFSLQLLSLGAPAHLVEASARAMADELKHAELAFTLSTRFAGTFAGTAVGPGPLPVAGCLSETSLTEILRCTILEGCIGETIASGEANLARQAVRDAEVSRVLGIIERDETAHCHLAWKFVQWVLEQHPELRDACLGWVEQELMAARAARAEHADASRDHARDAALRAYGIVSEAERAELRLDVLAGVVLPCMRELCAMLPRNDVTRSAAPSSVQLGFATA